MLKKKIEADSSQELDEEGNDDPVRLVGKAHTVDEDLGGIYLFKGSLRQNSSEGDNRREKEFRQINYLLLHQLLLQ